jgi:hypothetical protein
MIYTWQQAKHLEEAQLRAVPDGPQEMEMQKTPAGDQPV